MNVGRKQLVTIALTMACVAAGLAVGLWTRTPAPSLLQEAGGEQKSSDHGQPSTKGESSDGAAVKPVGGKADEASRGAANPSDETPTVSSAITEWSVYQNLDHGGESLITFDLAQMDREPHRLALHDGDIYMFLTFREVSDKQIRAWIGDIQATGGVAVTLDPESPSRGQYRVLLKHIPDEATITLGDMPPITFYRAKPLTWTAAPINEPDASLLFFAKEYGNRLIMPEDDQDVVVSFPEDMDTEDATVEAPGADAWRWLDDRHLKVHLRQAPVLRSDVADAHVTFEHLYSQSGNYAEPGFGDGFEIIRAPARKWEDLSDGKGWNKSPRDGLYDRLVLSPDGSRYIGLYDLGGPIADGIGEAWGAVLESPGKPPVKVEDVFFTSATDRGDPFVWLDDAHIVFGNWDGLYAYDADSHHKQLLAPPQDNRMLLDFNVRPAGGLVATYAVWKPGEQTAEVDRQFYADANSRPKPYGQRTRTEFSEKIGAYDAPVFFEPGGTYTTDYRDGEWVTRYRPVDGRVSEVPGMAIAAFPSGVCLEFPGTDSVKFSYWRPGSDPRPLTMDSPQPFGPWLLATDIIGGRTVWKKYDPKTQKWTVLEPRGGRPLFPAQARSTWYRVDVNDQP